MASVDETLDELVRANKIAPEWMSALRDVDPRIDAKVAATLQKVADSGPTLPDEDRVWRAFEMPPSSVRVLILGQDPYPNAHHAVGLSFSTGPGGPIPGSLQNIYRELTDSRYAVPDDGDLSPWTSQGVMLLNRALTVPADKDARPKRHVAWWRPLATATAKVLAQEAQNRPVAALLWGTPAHRMRKHLGPDVKVFASSHPSGLSVGRPAGGEPPFLSSRPFAAVNSWMAERGAPEIDWSLRREPFQPGREQ